MNRVSNVNKLIESKNSNIFFWVLLLIIAIFVIILLLFLIQYIRTPCSQTSKKNFFDYLASMNYADPCNEPVSVQEYEQRERKDEEEVWHIKDQVYTFDEAREKCKAYGSRLASKNEMVKAFNNGAQWTTYGWSQNKEAYYPIQACEFVKLRREGLNIGPPGVNGGKFDSHIRFGANCYGVKPPGEVVKEKDRKCPIPEVCQTNPDVCKPLKSDNIAPFFPGEQWSEFQ